MSEKRARTRIPVEANVSIVSEDKAYSVYGRTRDISMKGLYVKSEASFTLGAKCNIDIIILGKSSQMIIKTCGTVMRQGKQGYGVLFDDDLEFWPLLAIMNTTNS